MPPLFKGETMAQGKQGNSREKKPQEKKTTIYKGGVTMKVEKDLLNGNGEFIGFLDAGWKVK